MTSTHGLPTPSVHRFWLPIGANDPRLRMPRGARVLHVSPSYLGVGPGNPIIEIWAHGDLDAPDAERRFAIVATGHLADVDPATHVGTVIFEDRGFARDVVHVFDLGEAL